METSDSMTLLTSATMSTPSSGKSGKEMSVTGHPISVSMNLNRLLAFECNAVPLVF